MSALPGSLEKSHGQGNPCVRRAAVLVGISLQTGISMRLRRRPGRMAALLMLGLWLGLIGLSSSESLHRFFHSDSQQANHECLVTFFSKSYLLAAFAPIAALLVIFVCFGLLRLAEAGLPS